MLTLPSHRKTIKGNTDSIILSMNITEKPMRRWNLQRRMPAIIATSVKAARAEQQEKLNNLLSVSEKQNYGVKKFLVVKKFQKLFSPIGFRQTFKTIQEVIAFAKTENRETVRVITGAVKKDYPVNK